jgi:hypothetical protein
MKRAARVLVVVAFAIALAASAGYAADPKYSGFLGDYYKNLQPGPKDGAKERWVKPGIDFSKYKKLMIDSVVFYLADDSEDKSINAEEMKELQDAFNQELVTALKEKYPLVAEPAPDVMHIKIAITGVKKSSAARSTISTVLPVGLGLSLIRKGATGSWTGSGGTKAEFMAMDSTTGDVIAIAIDERTAGFTERFTSLGAAKDAFKAWAERIRAALDSIQPPAPKSSNN